MEEAWRDQEGIERNSLCTIWRVWSQLGPRNSSQKMQRINKLYVGLLWLRTWPGLYEFHPLPHVSGISRLEWSQPYQHSQDMPARQRCIATLSLQLTVSQQGCKLQPQMPGFMMPGEELFSCNTIERNLTRNQGVWSKRECYVPKIRDTSLVEVRHKWALAREDILHQHTDVRGPRVRCVLQDQHSISGYDGVLQNFDITQAGRT